MHSREGFLETILATPDDDAPRLVFSDWLEDHGDLARAEFIRAQCELATLSPRERGYRELAWRIEMLLGENRTRWIAELPGLDGVEWLDFERGFVSTVRVPEVKVLYRHDKAIAQAAPVFRIELTKLDESKNPRPEGAAPWVRILRMTGRGDLRTDEHDTILAGITGIELTQMHEYHDSRWLTRHASLPDLQTIRLQGSHTAGQAIASWAIDHGIELTRLEVGTRFVDYNSGYFEDPTMGSEGTVALANAASFSGLEALNLNRQRIGPQGFQAIVSSPRLDQLRELELRAAQTSDVSVLETSTGTPLVRLDLSLNQISERGARSLGQSKRLAQLERLDLDTCEINASGLEALTKARFWKTLRQLDLSRNPLGAAGAKVLAKAGEPAHLHTLTLVDCDLDAKAARTLAGISWLRKLLVLDLSGNPLEAAGVAHLAGLAGGSLRSLTLTGTGVDETTAANLAPLVPRLIQLDLSNNPLANAGLPALLQAGPAPDLMTLRLARCQVSLKGLNSLCAEGVCPHLHTLDLSGNTIGYKGVELLLRAPLLASVRELHLKGCNLDAETAELIAKCPALASCSVLNLRDNDLGEDGLLTLAQSKHLLGTTLQLSGNPWRFPEASRKILADRFGQYWYHFREEEEEEQDADEEFDDDLDDDDDEG
jgi:uncharacterized protein (TIGR02996 family)